MRNQFVVFAVCALTAGAFYSAAAFSAGETGARTVSATLVGDATAYLTLEVNSGSASSGFVGTGGTPAKIDITFDNGGVTGTGINGDSTYWFDDLVKVTNNGAETVKVAVNATATDGVVQICYKTTTGAMDNACYGANSGENSITVGTTHYIGFAVNSSTSTTAVTGNIYVTAMRGA